MDLKTERDFIGYGGHHRMLLGQAMPGSLFNLS